METLSLPTPRQVAVVLAAQAARAAMLDLAARLAPAGPLRVLDGGNHFNAYEVARAVRRQTAQLEWALGNIRLARAFTCYQMLALLEETPAASAPTLVLDLLCTFYDENVRLPEARRLLALAVCQLARLAEGGPVVASARPPGYAVSERTVLIEDLQAALPLMVQVPAPALPAARQMALFA